VVFVPSVADEEALTVVGMPLHARILSRGETDLVDGITVKKVGAVSQSKSNNVWI
jgi:hypothetical protein